MCHRIIECGVLTGTGSAEGIMASGHVNRVNRPNTWPQPTSCIVKKTLANREPSTHGTSRPNRRRTQLHIGQLLRASGRKGSIRSAFGR